MRILGIDYGEKRIGLALTDPDAILAYPYATLVKSTRDKLFADLTKILDAEGVQCIVLGLPVDLYGAETLITRQVRNFAASLGRRTDIPIHLADERLSTQAAMDDLSVSRLSRKRKKAVVDQQAAVRILESWLARRKNDGPEEGCGPTEDQA